MTKEQEDEVARLGAQLRFPVAVTMTAEKWGLLVADLFAVVDVYDLPRELRENLIDRARDIYTIVQYEVSNGIKEVRGL